jgi:aspartate aminotransferase-like enzyme
MESAVVNTVSAGDEVLVASCGNFGVRWNKLATTYGAVVTMLEYEWGTRVDPDDVRRALAENPAIKAVFVQQSETSTGVVNDIAAMGAIVAETPALFVVDAISGLGATDLKTDAWHVDVCVSGSQKALMTPPGLAFVAVSEKAWPVIEANASPRFYFDFVSYRKKMTGDSAQTPYTPAVSALVAQNKAIEMIRDEGLENVFERHRVLSRAAKEGMKAIGLELFGPDDPEANSVTAVKVPDGVDGTKIGKLARDKYGVWLAGGQGKLKGRIFRLGHCGYFGASDIVVGLSTVEMVLAQLGYDVPFGASLAAAERVFLKSEVAL